LGEILWKSIFYGTAENSYERKQRSIFCSFIPLSQRSVLYRPRSPLKMSDKTPSKGVVYKDIFLGTIKQRWGKITHNEKMELEGKSKKKEAKAMLELSKRKKGKVVINERNSAPSLPGDDTFAKTSAATSTS
jgi:uncharacterized protein YjbJ (UPF0337 family)